MDCGKLPKDKCPYCGHERNFGVWVAAHWSEFLETTCENEACKKPYAVRRGIAFPIRQRKRIV